jgi:hypothetical protein
LPPKTVLDGRPGLGQRHAAERWIRASVCIYQARDPASIREHARRVGMPGDQIFPVVKTIVVRNYPVDASAAA